MPDGFLDFIPGPVSSNPAPTDTTAAGLGYEPSMGTYNGSLDSDDAGWGTVSLSNGVAVITDAGPGSIPTGVPVVDMKADAYFKTTFVSPELTGESGSIDDSSPNPIAERTTWTGQTEWVDIRAGRTNSKGT